MATENRHRLWGFGTPRIVKHMPRVKTVAAGFYSLNGTSVLRAVESLHKERIVEVFEAIREQNPTGRILIVLDNFSSHVSQFTRTRVERARNHAGILLYRFAASSADRTRLGWSQTNYLAISTESADGVSAQ